MSKNIAREGAPKKTVKEIPTTHGMRRQTVGELHPYLHGQCVEDEPLQKTYEKPVEIHRATMVDQYLTLHPVDNDPSAILRGDVAPTGIKSKR